MKKIILIFLVVFIFSSIGLNSKEAVILVGGVIGNKRLMKRIEKQFENDFGYDVYWIDFMTRKSWGKCMDNLETGLSEAELEKYEKVHMFCHIFGGRLVLDYFNDHKIKNLESIVFDRGPIQEELSTVARQKSGDKMLILFGGRSLLTFSYKEHFLIPKNLKDVNIGIIVEAKAMPLCYLYRKEIKENNPSFLINDIAERYDDFFYIPLNHRQMYSRYEVFIDEVDRFYRSAKFSDDVNRTEKNYMADF